MIRIIIPILFSSLNVIYLVVVALSLNPQNSAINAQAEWRLNGQSILVNLFSLHVFLRNRIKVCGAARCSVNLEHHNSRLWKMTFKNLKFRQLKKNNLHFHKISQFLLNIYDQIFFQEIFFFLYKSADFNNVKHNCRFL